MAQSRRDTLLELGNIVTEEMAQYKAKIAELEAKRQVFWDEYDLLEKAEVKLVTVEDKRGSMILTRADGKAISMTERKGIHRERKVWHYDGKKRGELIDGYDRTNVHSWKVWLVNQD